MSSDLSVNSAVSSVLAMQRVQTASEAQMLVYRKALDIAAEGITSLLATLPQPALATSGTLGTRLNVYA